MSVVAEDNNQPPFTRWLIGMKDVHPDQAVRNYANYITGRFDVPLDMDIEEFSRYLAKALYEDEEKYPGFRMAFIYLGVQIFWTSYIPSLSAHMN